MSKNIFSQDRRVKINTKQNKMYLLDTSQERSRSIPLLLKCLKTFKNQRVSSFVWKRLILLSDLARDADFGIVVFSRLALPHLHCFDSGFEMKLLLSRAGEIERRHAFRRQVYSNWREVIVLRDVQ